MSEDVKIVDIYKKPKAIGQGKFSKLPIIGSMQPKHRQTTLAILAIIVLLIIGGVYYAYLTSKNNSEKRFNQTYSKYQKLQGKANTNEAKKLWLDYLNTNPTSKYYKAKAEFYLANVYYTVSDYQNARKYAEASLKDSASPDYNVYIFLGDLTNQLEDKQATINYYQEAVKLLEPQAAKSPRINNYLIYTKNKIMILQDNYNGPK